MTEQAQPIPLSLEMLRERRDEIIALAEKHGAYNVRVFGSVAQGEKHPNDIDFLVQWNYNRVSSWGGVGLDLALEKLLGYPVDIISENGLAQRLRSKILREAIPL